jgi:hypothetical protein
MSRHFFSRVIHCGLMASLVAIAPLMAKSPEFRLGAQVSLVLPGLEVGDTREKGYGATFFVEMNVDAKAALRGRVEYTKFGDGEYSLIGRFMVQ